MGNHKEELEKFEKKKLLAAIVAAKGNLGVAAKALGMPLTTLAAKIERYPDIDKKTRDVREKAIGHRGRGRPRFKDTNRTKKEVTKAWRASKGVYADCARLLKLPQSTVKQLIKRYGLAAPKKKTA